MDKELENSLLDEEEDTLKNKYLTFQLEQETYGMDIQFVIEIIGVQPITHVPELPEYIKGVINLRGKIIPVMDMRLRFRKTQKEYDDKTCIVVVEINSIAVGLIVDTVSEVLVIEKECIAEPPMIGKDFPATFIKGIGKVGDQVKLLLDCAKLIDHHELSEVAN